MLNSQKDTLLRRLATVMVSAIALFAVAGCGGGDEGDAEDVVKDFANALAEGDGEKACDQLAEDAKKPIEQGGGKCAQLLEGLAGSASDEDKNQLKDIDPEVSVDGDEATAKVPNIGGEGDSEIKLKKEDGDWKITTLGN